MPIDLKWVRNNPEEVQEWQEQRGLADQGAKHLQDVVRYDDEGRVILKEMSDERKNLKQIQQSLRPSSKKQATQKDAQQQQQVTVDREQILAEMKRLQKSIKDKDTKWKDLMERMHQSLRNLASPIDTTQIANNADGSSMIATNHKKRKVRKLWDLSSNRGLDVSHATFHWARRCFDRYSMIQLPQSIPVLSKSESAAGDSSWALEPDLAHAMWGPVSRESSSSLPAWLGILASEFSSTKTIFGAKQLPQYTAIASDSKTLELLAMTAGTMWDSRSAQNELVQDLLDFYKSLVLPISSTAKIPSSCLMKQSASAKELKTHECSRISILLKDEEGDVTILGWVSNFGDAASRACDIAFAGGGSKQKKDYVHFVHATMLYDETLSCILHANTRDDKVALSKCLSPYLIMTKNEQDAEDESFLWIPLDSLTIIKQAVGAAASHNNNNNNIFAPPKTTKTRWATEKNRTKMPLLDVAVPPSQEQINQEAASCSFDFLFQ